MPLDGRSTVVRVPKAGELIAASLRRQIITGELEPGEPLPNEAALMERFGVSRPTLREAFRILTSKGLVEGRPKAGTRVCPRSQWSLLDPDLLAWHFEAQPSRKFLRNLFELRLIVEPGAARDAAQIAH